MNKLYKEYYLKKGDTLQKIAEEFCIDIDRLREFHNCHCELSDLIGDGTLPVHLKFLIIPTETKTKSEILNNIIKG